MTNPPEHENGWAWRLPGRLELNVGDEATPVAGLPDERLRIVWDDFDGGAQKDPTWARYAVGSAVLAILLVLALLANARAVGGLERRNA